jgi:hypothetical protein
MKGEVIVIENIKISQYVDGRFSLTDLWKASGSEHKFKPNYWLENNSTQEKIEYLKSRNSGFLPIVTKAGKNGATFACKQLVYDYAMWLSPEFNFKVIDTFDDYINSQLKEKDWRQLRHESAASFKVMNAVLQLQRQLQGKDTESKHYMCEAKLVNWALTGQFKGVDRGQLGKGDLDLLARLEERNTVLLGVGLSYDERKLALNRFSQEWRKPIALEMAA